MTHKQQRPKVLLPALSGSEIDSSIREIPNQLLRKQPQENGQLTINKTKVRGRASWYILIRRCESWPISQWIEIYANNNIHWLQFLCHCLSTVDKHVEQPVNSVSRGLNNLQVQDIILFFHNCKWDTFGANISSVRASHSGDFT